MSEIHAENSRLFYGTLIAGLLSSHARYTDGFYLHEKLDDDYSYSVDDVVSGYALTDVSNDEAIHRAALEDKRAFFSIHQQGATAREAAYGMFRLCDLNDNGEGSTIAARAQLASGFNIEQPVAYEQRSNIIIPDPLKVPFLNRVHERIQELTK